MMTLFATGCATTGPVDSYCDLAQPFYLTLPDIEVLSPGLLRDIWTHNETGRAICGWKRR